MKGIKKYVLLLALVLMVCCLFACTEKTKQTAIGTDKTYTAVTSNGGLAVQYGNYLYFVNGYAGSSVLNTFGSVKTGAVCRVELKKDSDGKLFYDYKTFEVVVPKNVYGTDTVNGGIYIVDDYIYYHTTSVDKDKDRNYKTDEGVLMRTKIDGSASDVIANFTDNATAFRVAGNYIAYLVSNEGSYRLHVLKTSDLSEVETETEDVVEYLFSDTVLVYSTYNKALENAYTKDRLVKVFDFLTGRTKIVLSSEIYGGDYLYVTSVKDVQETEDSIRMFYTKDDNSIGDVNNGYYFCNFTRSDPTYNKSHEVRLTYSNTASDGNATYDKFFRLQNGYILTYKDKVFQFFDGSKQLTGDDNKVLTYELTGAAGLIGVYETDDEVYAYFTTTGKSVGDKSDYTALNYVKLFKKELVGGKTEYTLVRENVKVFFYFSANVSYINYEVTDLRYFDGNNVTAAKAVYFLNANKGDLAYYFIIRDGNDRKNAEELGALLGKIDEEKLVSMVSSGAVTEE